MKLLFCFECGDVFGLIPGHVKTCDCGLTKGRYINKRYAEVNGEGISLGLSLPDLRKALYAHGMDTRTDIECWARPHTGELNPHTTINKDLV